MARIARFSLLLALAAPLWAQNVPFSSLHAKVTNLFFFPSPKDMPDVMLRFYPTTLDSATTEYIDMELGLEYPAVAAASAFTLQCTYAGPGGYTATPALNGHIEAGWTGSRHAAGWGSETRGTWAVGDYQVTCKDGETTVATGKFTVSRDNFSVPALHAVVSTMAFFESAQNALTPLAQRQYAETFTSASTRTVNVQLGFDFPVTTAPAQFDVSCDYTYPDQRKFNATFTAKIEAGWTGAYVAGGIGYDEPGKWPAGSYHVECRNAGVLIAKANFTVQ